MVKMSEKKRKDCIICAGLIPNHYRLGVSYRAITKKYGKFDVKLTNRGIIIKKVE